MQTEPKKIYKSKVDFLESSKLKDLVKANKASTEIMLDRFCQGNEADFPFSKS